MEGRLYKYGKAVYTNRLSGMYFFQSLASFRDCISPTSPWHLVFFLFNCVVGDSANQKDILRLHQLLRKMGRCWTGP